MKNIFDTIADLLLTNDKYKAENGKLLKAVVFSDIMKMDEDLLTLLLSNEDAKESFFKDVQGTLVFDKQKFAWFMESKEFLPDSYTSYTNRIGLTHNGNFISQTNDVVLDFPYKDCVLEGGQDKDDQKRSEIFYNETIASNEISRMLAPKVFTNAKRYTAVGEKDLTGKLNPNTIHVEEETGITLRDDDNLILKGNNLIALASLLKHYEGKVKCICIDPPYNTQNDSFNYNDSFNHSTWLTFMKNRLEICKKMLADNGCIFIILDDNEYAYCKILVDDLFGRENHKATFIWNHRKSKQNDIDISLSHNYIMCYIKESSTRLYPLGIDEEGFSNPDNDPRGLWKADPFDAPNIRPNLTYTITNPNTGDQHLPPSGRCWRFSQEKFASALKDNRIIWGKNGKGRPQYKRFLSEANLKGNSINTIWSDVDTATSATKHLMQLFDTKNVFSTPKPESLIEKILSISTKEKDTVLDFFAGSGTTAAAAHKMGRRYIGVEQMDYIQDITVKRLKKVLEGEQGGISKAQNWHGGGSFVYCELKEDANTLINTIQNATKNTIESVKVAIYADDRIVPYLTKQELVDANKDFESLTLEEKKQALIKLVDKNKLYINASDLDDSAYEIDDADRAFTKSFYEEA